jgi:catalase-peroxidase
MQTLVAFGVLGIVAIVLTGCGSSGGNDKKTATTGQCTLHAIGSPSYGKETHVSPSDKRTYHKYLETLDVQKLYDTIVRVMKTSQECWPADGPQDGDQPSYAGLFGRLAWHCAGSLRIIDGKSTGGCEGGRNRHWPEREWRDNANLDQARAILAEVKIMPEYQQLSWGDLITFAGTVGIKASSGPAHKFCFGRIDDSDGRKSIMLGSEGIEDCGLGKDCISHAPCQTNFRWPEQDSRDDPRCNLTQADGRHQASHSVGLIYVYPHGPQLRENHPEYDITQKHQRSRRLGAEEVRDTFRNRMGWTDQETVALIGGGHTLGRAHGNCASKSNPDEPCKGKYTTTAGYEGAWTRTPSQWNYDYFEAMLEHEWTATKSPEGNDQWGTKNSTSPFATTFRLTADLALVSDPIYKKWVIKYHKNHTLFDHDFARAWFKLMHRSTDHPEDDDLEMDANKCTTFDFMPSIPSAVSPSALILTDATIEVSSGTNSAQMLPFIGAAGLMAVATLSAWSIVSRRRSTENTNSMEGAEMREC